MNNLIDNSFDAVSDNHWANYCKHVEHTEQETWMADNLQDVGPLIVQLADSSGSSYGAQDSVDMTGVAPPH
jgi:hypothetical protein